MNMGDAVTQPEKIAWFKRTEYDRSDSETRAQLLKAAEQVFAEVGYSKATIASITEVAGVSRATFYAYFRSRREVFYVLIEPILDGVRTAQRAVGVDAGDPRAVIESSIITVMRLYSQKASLLTVIEQQARVDNVVAELWNVFWEGQIVRQTRFIERMQAEQLIGPEVEPRLTAESLTVVLLHHGIKSGSVSGDELDALGRSLAHIYGRTIGLR
jgi:AcrR family transcriptional regulator